MWINIKKKILENYFLITNSIENMIRQIIIKFTNYLPVKVIKDDNKIPFLYRYHVFAFTDNGPGICIHHFVNSDPDRGFHDHPWSHSLSFILAGGYEERLDKENPDKIGRKVSRWSFNYLNGKKTFHRVMLPKNEDAWTIFFFTKRSKTWGFWKRNNDELVYKQMAKNIHDDDAGWWKTAPKGHMIKKTIN